MKRFTETQKWEDPWFRRLAPEMKLLWQWLIDRCDNAGVIDPDLELASFHIGYQYPMDTLSQFDGRVLKLPGGKHFIPKFIEFQYGQLSEECRAHNPIFASLKKHGINRVSNRVSDGVGYPPIYTSSLNPPKEGEYEDAGAKGKARGTRQEFIDYAARIGLPAKDGEYLHDHLLENGWKRGKAPIKDWRATMRKWKTGKWLPSLKDKQLSGKKGEHSSDFTGP